MKDCGFTLLELVVVLALVAVLGAMSALRGHALLEGYCMQAAKRTLSSALDSAAAQARESGSVVSVRFGTHQLQTTSLSGKRAVPLPCDIRIHSAAFASVSGEERVARFQANGNATPGSIELRNGYGRRCRLIQALRGARRIACDEAAQ